MELQEEFLMEQRLRELDPGLHRRFTDTVLIMPRMLDRSKRLFPEYTDHTMLHSLSVIRFCNQLIGPEQIKKLNADTIYVLLMSCYLHDSGMGISDREYREFSREIDFGEFFEKNPDPPVPEIVRSFHQEYSGLFIRKYAEFLEIPSPEHVFAIVQVSRGHRKTDLMDAKEYPACWRVPGGGEICLPYLAALIRLADEIDVAADRNPILLYDLEVLEDELEILYRKRHQAVRELLITKESFRMRIEETEPEVMKMLQEMTEKMQQVLDLARAVTEQRTPFILTQRRVEIEWIRD